MWISSTGRKRSPQWVRDVLLAAPVNGLPEANEIMLGEPLAQSRFESLAATNTRPRLRQELAIAPRT